MFTGIVQQIGALRSRQRHDGDESLVIDIPPGWLTGANTGDSIAVNGVCLTATTIAGDRFGADVSAETLSKTTLGELAPGDAVNLERALRPLDALGGHLVSGHVDSVAEVLERSADSRSERIWIGLPAPLARLVAPKGNICVDGTSLTVNEVESGRFGVNIVPHTLEATIAGSYRPGTRVNLEVDIVARYVARLLDVGDDDAGVGVER